MKSMTDACMFIEFFYFSNVMVPIFEKFISLLFGNSAVFLFYNELI